MIFKEFDLITPFLYPYFRVFQTKGTKEWEISFTGIIKALLMMLQMTWPIQLRSGRHALNVD